MLSREKVKVKPYRPLRVKWDNVRGMTACVGGRANIPPLFSVTMHSLIVNAAIRGGTYAR